MAWDLPEERGKVSPPISPRENEQGNATLRAALGYLARGWSVIPIRAKDKRPLLAWTKFQKRAATPEDVGVWWQKWPDAGAGIVTGAISGLVVLDIDGEAGEESLRALQKEHGALPPTPEALTGGGGRHLLFGHPGGRIPNKARFAAGLDTRADGGYIVAPPSVHPNGKAYAWELSAHPDDVPPAPPPLWLLTTIAAGTKKPAAATAKGEAGWVEEALRGVANGERNDTAARLAGHYLVRRLSVAETVTQLLEWDKRNRPPLGEDELREVVASIAKKEQVKVAEEGDGAEIPAAGAEAKSITPNIIADAICEQDFFARDAGGRLHFFYKGAYSPRADIRIGARAKGLLRAWGRPDQWTSRKIAEVGAYIGADCPELWEAPPLDRLNLLNGLLDVETGELLPHTPDFLSPIQLPVRFDPDAECPAWDALVAELLPADCGETIFEIAAWLMLPHTDFQKALLLQGLEDAGKSTILQALRRFLGVGNCVSASLHKLETNQFAPARLLGKLANICPDLPSTHLESTSMFKAITGGDYIEAERKFGHAFDFKPYSRLVFSANHHPQSADSSAAFFRRWLVLPFDRSIPEAKKVGREIIDARLADPSQLSGVLIRALAALPRVRRHGVEETPSMREAHDQFRESTDPLTIWLNRETVTHPEAMIDKALFLRAYNAHCHELGRPTLGPHAFTKALRRARPQVTESQLRSQGDRSRFWRGIDLKPKAPA